MKTVTRSAGALLLIVGLLLYIGDRWNTENLSQEGVNRDRHAGPERTFDDSQRFTITLLVRYRPARQIEITWGIGEDGDRESRYRNQKAEWSKTRTNVKYGTLVGLAVDNFDQGGYLNCEIWQNKELVRHFADEHTTHRDFCDLYFTVGDGPDI